MCSSDLKAVELVTDAVRAETQLQDEKIVSDYKDWCLAPERRYSPAEKGLIGKVLGKAQELIHKAAQKVLARVQAVFICCAIAFSRDVLISRLVWISCLPSGVYF